MGDNHYRPHVLIAGAGLGGLTLAQCLRKQGVSFEIFERDASDNARSQGWAIGIHTMLDDLVSSMPSDMPDLKESVDHLLPLKLNAQICYYLAEGRFGVEDTPEWPVVRANRTLLRQWLAHKIPIKWGKCVQRIENQGEKVTAYFEDGSSATGDILVGADGVKSAVREHLLQRPNKEVLQNIPIASIGAEVRLSGSAMERQLSLGHSCWTAPSADNTNRLFVGLNKVCQDGVSGDYYWFFLTEDDEVGHPDHWLATATKEEKLSYARKHGETMDPRLTEIMDLTPVDGVLNHSWVAQDADISNLPVGRVTLLGDAAHPMTPFRGEGGVHALIDALRLSKVIGEISNTGIDAKTALRDYQAEMLERGHQAVLGSRGASRNASYTPTATKGWGQMAVPLSEESISLTSIV